MGDQVETTDDPNTTPPKKKQKRLQKYRAEWEEENPWVKKVPENIYKANCTVCHRAFSISHGGLHDLKQHASSAGHANNMRGKKQMQTLDQFVVQQASPEADKVCKKTSGLLKATTPAAIRL